VVTAAVDLGRDAARPRWVSGFDESRPGRVRNALNAVMNNDQQYVTGFCGYYWFI
jgi:hypothetical protein